MASKAEWLRYHLLRELIAEAVEDFDEYCRMTIAIAPDLETVVVKLTGKPWEEGFVPGEDWHIEHANGAEEAIGLAEYYFDLR